MFQKTFSFLVIALAMALSFSSCIKEPILAEIATFDGSTDGDGTSALGAGDCDDLVQTSEVLETRTVMDMSGNDVEQTLVGLLTSDTIPADCVDSYEFEFGVGYDITDFDICPVVEDIWQDFGSGGDINTIIYRFYPTSLVDENVILGGTITGSVTIDNPLAINYWGQQYVTNTIVGTNDVTFEYAIVLDFLSGADNVGVGFGVDEVGVDVSIVSATEPIYQTPDEANAFEICTIDGGNTGGNDCEPCPEYYTSTDMGDGTTMVELLTMGNEDCYGVCGTPRSASEFFRLVEEYCGANLLYIDSRGVIDTTEFLVGSTMIRVQTAGTSVNRVAGVDQPILGSDGMPLSDGSGGTITEGTEFYFPSNFMSTEELVLGFFQFNGAGDKLDIVFPLVEIIYTSPNGAVVETVDVTP